MCNNPRLGSMEELVIIFLLSLFSGAVPSKINEIHDDLIQSSIKGSVSSFCQLEAFQPKCLKDEIIVIKSATYGRMRIGKCITAEEVSGIGGPGEDNKRYFGCSTDVMSILEGKCSLKSECEVRIPDAEMDRTNPCFPGLKLYLDASYDCINVVENDRICHVLAAHSAKHLLSSINTDLISSCGSNIQPWVIESPKGQRVKVTYVSIGSKKSRGSRVSHRCSAANQGIVIDKLGRRNVSVCEGSEGWSLEDDQQYYLSEGSVLQIILTQKREDIEKFLLKIEATGCSDIIPPEDAWLKRNTDAIVIGCYSSKQTWHLHCDNRQWIGVVGNCSADAANSDDMNPIPGSQFEIEIPGDQQVLIIVAICGFGIVVCLTIICVGAVCLRRFTAKHENKQEDNPVLHYYSIHANDPRFSSYRTSATNCHLANGKYDTAKPLLYPNQMVMKTNTIPSRNTSQIGRNENQTDAMDSMHGNDARYFVLDPNAVAEENATLYP